MRALALVAVEQLLELPLGVGHGRLRGGDRRVGERPVGGGPAGALAVGDRLHERVPAQAVRAVDGDAGALARPRRGPRGGLARRGRCRRRPCGSGSRAEPGIGSWIGSTPAKTIESSRVPCSRSMILLRAEMAQVEEDVAVDAAAFVDLGLLRARDDVAARQLHRVRRVVLEEALALRVEEVRALAAAALGDEHPRRRERRRVELHHLHVFQRHADAGARAPCRRRCRSRRSSCPV